MTDVNSSVQPFQSFGGYETADTILLAPSATAGTATTAQLALPTQVTAGLGGQTGQGEWYVDVLNGTSGLIAVAFGVTAAQAAKVAAPTGAGIAGAGSYVMAAGERRTFLCPPTTQYIGINPTVASSTGDVYATIGKGRA
jgi:hypothetical protein